MSVLNCSSLCEDLALMTACYMPYDKYQVESPFSKEMTNTNGCKLLPNNVPNTTDEED